MSKERQTQLQLARELKPAAGSIEPDVWFQELRLLHRLTADKAAQIRRINLNPGLNILWSPPEDPETNTTLYQESWGGHAAGKTLFCRILRYLLGEPNFSTEAVAESIQGTFLELWAVARVRVRGEAWIVGRSLNQLGAGFAARGDNLDAVLQAGAPPDDFETFRSNLKSHLEVRQQRLEQLEKSPEPPAIRSAREAYEAAHGELIRVRQAALELSHRVESLARQGNDLMGTADRVRSAGIVDPKRAAEGWCPRTLEWAQNRGCVEKPSGADQSSGVTLAELEAQANRLLKEAQQAGSERNRCESRLEQLEAVLSDRSAKYAEMVRDSRREASAVQREVTLIQQCQDRLISYQDTVKALDRERRHLKTRLEKQEAHRAEIVKLREAAENDLRYFNEVYGDVIKAVVGASVDGWLKIDGNGLHLHATKQGELSGAALETVKTLAFDLAGVVAGVEGKGQHPRFLIHDGPREADMARVIYEKFFLYVVERLEAVFPSKQQANFQYILTTTTSPPKNMQEGSEWLIAKLSSRTKEDRLLGENV